MRFSRVAQWVSLILALVLLIISAPNVWAAVSGLLQGGATLTVNVTSDEPDNLPGDGLCQTASGDCSLRAALEEANVLPGLDAIHFNLPGNSPHVILVGSPLPSVTEAVVIDGRSQPDYSDSPTVVLDGSLAGAQSSGLTITAGDSTVQGLAIHSFSYSGIYLLGRANNQLEGNSSSSAKTRLLYAAVRFRFFRLVGSWYSVMAGVDPDLLLLRCPFFRVIFLSFRPALNIYLLL